MSQPLDLASVIIQGIGLIGVAGGLIFAGLQLKTGREKLELDRAEAVEAATQARESELRHRTLTYQERFASPRMVEGLMQARIIMEEIRAGGVTGEELVRKWTDLEASPQRRRQRARALLVYNTLDEMGILLGEGLLDAALAARTVFPLMEFHWRMAGPWIEAERERAREGPGEGELYVDWEGAVKLLASSNHAKPVPPTTWEQSERATTTA